MVTQQQANTNQARVVSQRKAMIAKATGGAKLSVPTKKYTTVTKTTSGGGGQTTTTSETIVHDSKQEASVKAERLAEENVRQAERAVASGGSGSKTAGQVVREARVISQKYGVREMEVIRGLSSNTIAERESKALEDYEPDREVLRTQRVRISGDKVNKVDNHPSLGESQGVLEERKQLLP